MKQAKENPKVVTEYYAFERIRGERLHAQSVKNSSAIPIENNGLRIDPVLYDRTKLEVSRSDANIDFTKTKKPSFHHVESGEQRRNEQLTLPLRQNNQLEYEEKILRTGDSRDYIPHQESQSQPTFGNRYQQNGSLEQLKAWGARESDESEVKRLNSLVEAQRKIISQMQQQLRAEKEKNKRPSHDPDQPPFSPHEMRERVVQPPPPQTKSSDDNIDMMVDIYRQRQKEWQKVKQKTPGGGILSPVFQAPYSIKTPQESNIELEPEVIIPPKLVKRRVNKSKSKSRSKSKGSLNISTSKLSSKSGTKSCLNKSLGKINGKRSSSKLRIKGKKNKTVARRLSMGSINASNLSGNFKKKKKKTKTKTVRASEIETEARNAIFKMAEEDPLKANRLIGQLVSLVTDKMNSHPTTIPLKPVKRKKSLDKTKKK